MIEQYVYDRIVNDETLQELLSAGSDDLHVYPAVVPREVQFDQAVTFTLIGTVDAFPAVNSVNVQFNIFAKTHAKTVEIAQALAALFNDDNNKKDDTADISIVYSIRQSESDLGFNFDDGLYQREATYYFKVR